MRDQEFVVKVDAICGAGMILRLGDIVLESRIVAFLDMLVDAGAVEPVLADQKQSLTRAYVG